LRPANLGDLELTSGDCFVLQRVARNLPHHVVDKLLTELNKRCSSKKKEKHKDRSFATEETNKLLLPQETDKLLIRAEEGEKEKLSLATDDSDIV
jgi:hypothetical protein